MTKLFDKNNLNKEQQERWDWAVLKYREIREKNTLNSFEQINEEERIQLIYDLNEAKEFNGSLTLDMVDEKSALFARLLNGKSPFIFPPPCAYSYPWYEVIEENGPWSLSVEAQQLEDILWENLHGEQQILIEQTPWKILSKDSDTEIKVTFGKWETLDFQWVLKKVKKSCTQTKSFIYCHHKPNVVRITNYEDLKNEQLYQINKEFDKIKLILDNDFQETYKFLLIKKYGNSPVMQSVLASEIQSGEELLNERRQAGLTDYPSMQEIEKLAQEKVNKYLNSGYIVNENGDLFVEVWVLEKIKGKVTPEIYMEI